jgi:glyoxylase-like metal-dependent hydrolase (beta-lactamase superfamily II)
MNNSHINAGRADFSQSWTALEESSLEALDIFQDGTVKIVHSPGHLPGHINLLVRQNPGGQVYLAGDACHDRRIIRKEREIGEWLDTEGHICCVHADKKKAEETIDKIRRLEEQGIEVIFAHDVEWEEDTKNRSRFWGASV